MLTLASFGADMNSDEEEELATARVKYSLS
jgi:hypothetical protein